MVPSSACIWLESRRYNEAPNDRKGPLVVSGSISKGESLRIGFRYFLVADGVFRAVFYSMVGWCRSYTCWSLWRIHIISTSVSFDTKSLYVSTKKKIHVAKYCRLFFGLILWWFVVIGAFPFFTDAFFGSAAQFLCCAFLAASWALRRV